MQSPLIFHIEFVVFIYYCLYRFFYESLGVWPLVYTCILLVDGQNQRFNGGVASLLSMVLGGFVLLPYCALRRSSNSAKYKLNFLVRVFDSQTISVLLILTTISLVLFATIFGDFHLFIHAFQTNRFIHIMSIDFFVVSWLFPYLIPDDLKRRKMITNQEFQTYFPLCFLPLIGPLIYLYRRKPLTQIKEQNA